MKELNENLKIRGDWVFERRLKDGTVLDREEIQNTIVNTGKTRLAELIYDDTADPFGFIAIGTGTTSVTTSDTALETEIDRQDSTDAYEASYKATFIYTFTFATGYNITEAGVFDSITASGSTMLNRSVFSAKACDENVDLYVKCTITVA